jgi:hypothetical protein
LLIEEANATAVPQEATAAPEEEGARTYNFAGLPLSAGVVLYNPKTSKKAKQIELETKIQDTDAMEDMILKAAKHVKTAKEMQEFANEKIRRAVESNSKPVEEQIDYIHHTSVDTIICDFCQNMGLPQLGEHQAGATYYYSPLTVNCFGIADCSVRDPHLTAYVYHEGEGKKGGNNVASLIMKHIKEMRQKSVTGEDKERDELNIVMDNCTGQNKNRMVLRLAPLLIEMEWYLNVNLIFLVAGHTKNAADRLFNLLKKEYRRSNIYNMEMLISALNKHELIEAIKAGPDDFLDWDKHLNLIYNSLPTGFVTQYQYFRSTVFRKGWLQAQVSCNLEAEGVQVNLKKQSLDDIERNILIKQPTVEKLVPPGIRAIKQVEMYDKWRKFIPAEHITDMYKQPETETVKELKEDRQQKKQQTKDKAATVIVAKKPTATAGTKQRKTPATKRKATTKKAPPTKTNATTNKKPPPKSTTGKKKKTRR